MELRKKSLLIALVLGDGCITEQTKTVKGKTYRYSNFEVTHSSKQKDYIEWKANICRKLTGRRCNISEKYVEKRKINGKITPALKAYRFTCCHKYFRILRKWLYPDGKKKLNPKYLNYLTPEGLAIWYMDDGSTYIGKKNIYAFTCEISTHIPEKDANKLIDMFRSKWNIEFHLHKKAENQYNIRTFGWNSVKFINLIKPFVPNCMDYKVKIPECYNHERPTSSLQGR